MQIVSDFNLTPLFSSTITTSLLNRSNQWCTKTQRMLMNVLYLSPKLLKSNRRRHWSRLS